MPEYPNIHGRKPGRGLRPWLLIPKYLCVAALLGGLLATCVLLPGMAEADDPSSGLLIRRIYLWQIIPATFGAMLLGILLLLQHPKEFLRMGWLRLKLVLILVIVPVAHFSLFHDVRSASITWPLTLGKTLACLLAFLLITFLGRLKPRM